MSAPTLDVAVKALVSDDEGRVLLLRRRSDATHWPGQWDAVGGKPEVVRGPGADPRCESAGETLRREAMEEIGVPIVIGRVLGVYDGRVGARRIVFVVFEAVLAAEAVPRASSEHESVRWATPADFASLDLIEPLAAVLRDATARHGA